MVYIDIEAQAMGNLEETLRNIDVFCNVLADKIIGKKNDKGTFMTLKPIEDFLRRKHVTVKQPEQNSLVSHMIPLPELDEPLIDILEDHDHVRVLVQCHCRNQRVTVHTSIDGIEICREERHLNADGSEICVDECRKLNLSTKDLQVKNIISSCGNNEVFEIEIPKMRC
ncbi:hypothetical protein A3K79_04905 [Candidatus Bathyarchaeota archaeon RBG_13_46_16b]|nr:MAG: hypothetical protein A3K79_04905 [Candidatus Bathyarchaeota archaeon RBG_13_46_16b]